MFTYKKVIVVLIILSVILVILLYLNKANSYDQINLNSDNVAFISDRYNKLDLVMVNKKGENLEKIMNLEEYVFDFSINPNDSSYVLIRKGTENNREFENQGLFLINRDKNIIKLVEETGANPNWNPKNKTFIYHKIFEYYHDESMMLSDFEFNEKRLSISDKVYEASWTSDGSELVYFIPDPKDFEYTTTDTIYKYNIDEDKEEKISLKKEVNLKFIEWIPKQGKISAIVHDKNLNKDSLIYINPKNGEILFEKDLNNILFYSQMDWSNDGRYLVFDAYKERIEDKVSLSKNPWPWHHFPIDIYLFDNESEEINNITNTEHSDYNPHWIP